MVVGGLDGRAGPRGPDPLSVDSLDTSAGLLLAGGGCGGGPRAIGDDPLTTFLDAGVGGLSAFLEFHVDAGLPGRGPVPLGMAGPIRPRPVGLSVGIPPAKRPPNCGGPPLDPNEGPLLGGIIGFGPAPAEPPPDDLEDVLPSITGALRSLVTVFFNAAPCRMAESS